MTNIPLMRIDSPRRRATDDLNKGVIINGRTGKVEQIEEKSDAAGKRFFSDDLLIRADEVIDTVTIAHRQNHLLPSSGLPKAA